MPQVMNALKWKWASGTVEVIERSATEITDVCLWGACATSIELSRTRKLSFLREILGCGEDGPLFGIPVHRNQLVGEVGRP